MKLLLLKSSFITLFFIFYSSFYGLCQNENIWKEIKTIQNKKNIKKKALRHYYLEQKDKSIDYIFSENINFGIKLSTNGFGGAILFKKRNKNNYSNIFIFSFQTLKHEKEIKRQRTGELFRDLGSFKPYFLGKINSVYNIQGGYGKERILFPLVINDKNNLSGKILIGPALIIEKPVFLNLIYEDIDGKKYVQSEKFSNLNEKFFLSENSILGADKYTKGLEEMKFVPGFFIDFGVSFDYLIIRNFMATIDIGTNLSYFTKPIEIMALNTPKKFHPVLYIGINFGLLK